MLAQLTQLTTCVCYCQDNGCGFNWHVKHMSKQTPPSFDGRQAQWVACTFSIEGVVHDSLRGSDADDLSQLTTVECIKPGPFHWR